MRLWRRGARGDLTRVGVGQLSVVFCVLGLDISERGVWVRVPTCGSKTCSVCLCLSAVVRRSECSTGVASRVLLWTEQASGKADMAQLSASPSLLA